MTLPIATRARRHATDGSGEPSIVERPVGINPAELHVLNPSLDIWDVYAVSHVIMPDGSMKLGRDAVARAAASPLAGPGHLTCITAADRDAAPASGDVAGANTQAEDCTMQAITSFDPHYVC